MKYIESCIGDRKESIKIFYVNEYRNLKINKEEDILSYITRFEEVYCYVVHSGKAVTKPANNQLIKSSPET